MKVYTLINDVFTSICMLYMIYIYIYILFLFNSHTQLGDFTMPEIIIMKDIESELTTVKIRIVG